MKFHRPERVGQLIRDEIAEFFLRELEFADTLVTVTEVVVSKDIEHAKIRVSILPSSKAEDIVKILKKRRQHFQHELYRKMNIRPMPLIDFEIDRGPEHAAAVEKGLME